MRMMAPFHFRQAALSDVAVLLTLMPRFYRDDGHPYDAAAAERALRELLESPSHGEIWLADLNASGDERRAVGYLALCLGFSLEAGGRDAFVDELYIVPELRGRGFGRQALELAAQRARALGARVLRLEVMDANPDAARLYLRSSFEDPRRRLLVRDLSGA